MNDQLAEEFAEHRPALVGAAYRVVGSVADAEDVVQETWLRWSAADRSEIRDDRAYLIRIASRLALNKLRQQKSRREQYVGPWLPEPIAAAPAKDDPAAAGLEVRIGSLNGERAFIAYDGDTADTVGFVQLTDDGLIDEIYLVRNPDKLTAIPSRLELT